jgi:hypothetical protein
MLPGIRKALSFAFRHLRRDARRDAIQECLASAWKAFQRLVECGKEAIAYATPLAMYAAKQYRAGRKVAGKVRGKWGGDVLAAAERGLAQVASISRYDRKLAAWQDITLADGRVTPADLAAFRLDFAAWLQRLPRTLRSIANALSVGERTKDVAQLFKLTPGRISQLRRELELSWEAFQGETA